MRQVFAVAILGAILTLAGSAAFANDNTSNSRVPSVSAGVVLQSSSVATGASDEAMTNNPVDVFPYGAHNK